MNKIKKASTTYYCTNPDLVESVTVVVNNEAKEFDHIKVDYDECWRSRADTITYLEWIINVVKNLPKE